MATPGQKRLRPNDDVGEGGTSGAGSPGDRRGSSMDVDNPNNDANNDSTMDDNFMYGRVKIRSRHGANQVRRWPRDKILLFLKDLPADFDEQWSQNPAFTQPVEQALRDAIEGPDAMMNLNELGAEPDCARVLGNEAAGRLLEPIFGKHRQLEVSGSATRERVDRIKRHLPLVPEGNGAMDGKLATLAPDASNADWLFDLLRNASRMWLDVRFRHLRDVGRYTADGGLDSRTVRLPPTLQVRGELINGMVHGGDVRMDALMCQLDFGYARYEHATYTPFLENAFRNTYGMTSEKAVWLCKSFASHRIPGAVSVSPWWLESSAKLTRLLSHQQSMGIRTAMGLNG